MAGRLCACGRVVLSSCCCRQTTQYWHADAAALPWLACGILPQRCIPLHRSKRTCLSAGLHWSPQFVVGVVVYASSSELTTIMPDLLYYLQLPTASGHCQLNRNIISYPAFTEGSGTDHWETHVNSGPLLSAQNGDGDCTLTFQVSRQPAPRHPRA